MEMANTTLYLTHESANTTDLFVTDSTSENVENNDKLIEDLSLVIQASMAFIGFIGNSLTFITLRRNGHIFATSVLKLIQSQAILDAIVCFLGSIYVLQPPMWKTHWNEYLDIFIRHVWHSQEFYWSNVITSVYNLVLIAFERYLAVCHPFKHAEFAGKTVNKAIAGIVIYNYVFHTFCIMQVSYRDGRCRSQYWVDGQTGINLFKFFGTWLLVVQYILPAIAFIYCYGRIVFVLNKRNNQDETLGSSKILRKANKQLSKTCIVVTCIFLLTLGFDMVYYFLGRMEFVPYVKNSFIQKMTMLCSIFNSMANPIVYTILMPNYRKAMMSTIVCKKEAEISRERTKSTDVTSVSDKV